MRSQPSNEQSTLSSPTLTIDFRLGSVVMRHGLDVWYGSLPMSKADSSQINTAGGQVKLEKLRSDLQPETGGSSDELL